MGRTEEAVERDLKRTRASCALSRSCSFVDRAEIVIV